MVDIKPFKRFINEDLRLAAQERSSFVAAAARSLGLEYYGFGRYGKNGTTTHQVVGNELRPFKKREDTWSRYKKNTDIIKQIMGKPEFDENDIKTVHQLSQENKAIKAEFDSEDESMTEYRKYVKEQTEAAEKTAKAISKRYNWKELSHSQQAALNAYAGGDYMEINRAAHLAAKNPNARELDDKTIWIKDSSGAQKEVTMREYMKILDSVLEDHFAPQAMTLFSGLSESYKDDVMKPGKTFIFPTYRSTSLSYQISNFFRGSTSKDPGERVEKVIQFDVKAGQRGYYMEGQNHSLEAPGEMEFLLPRNTKFKISDDVRTFDLPTGTKLKVYMAEIVEDD